MTTPQYSADQITFCHAALSNLSSMQNGTPQQIQQIVKNQLNSVYTNTNIQLLIGNWKVVWGPSVLTYNGKDLNDMYIAYCADTNQYVVAISGTNSKSAVDWITEDFEVLSTVTWPYLPEHSIINPCISKATSNGLNALINLKDSETGDTAATYLGKNKATNIIVSGHSLGGALSPTYALYLADTLSQWSQEENVQISVMALAGATPGDAAFSNYYTSRLGATTNRVWNQFDVVPHGFEADMLKKVKSIYDGTFHTPGYISLVIDGLVLATANKHYTQLMPETPGFSIPIWQKTSGFLDAALCNHICCYAMHFNVGDFQQLVSTTLGLSKPFFSDGDPLYM